MIGPLYALNLSEESTSVVSSGSVSRQYLALALDGMSSTCSSPTGTPKAWLRVGIQPVRFVRKVRLFLEGGEGDAVIHVGRSLRKNGALDNEKCGMVSRVDSPQWKNITCSQPVLGQFIYIESNNNVLKICEIQVFYGNVISPHCYQACFITVCFVTYYIGSILNMYSPVQVTASGQKELGSIWKPIDGLIGQEEEASWISLQSSQSWWRMELPHRSAIDRVIVYRPTFVGEGAAVKKTAMGGFAVYIGNFPVGNGSTNARCGNPQKATQHTVIPFNCGGALSGKYVYIAASAIPKAQLYLSEIKVYGCKGDNICLCLSCVLCNSNLPLLSEPQVEISSNQMPKSVNLTCQGTKTGCHVTNVDWTGPDGNSLNNALKYSLPDTIFNTVTIDGSALKGIYTCTITYTGGSAKGAYTYSG